MSDCLGCISSIMSKSTLYEHFLTWDVDTLESLKNLSTNYEVSVIGHPEKEISYYTACFFGHIQGRPRFFYFY